MQRFGTDFVPKSTLGYRRKEKHKKAATAQKGSARATKTDVRQGPTPQTATRPQGVRPIAGPELKTSAGRDAKTKDEIRLPVRFITPSGHSRTRTVTATTLERVVAMLGHPHPWALGEAQTYLSQIFAADTPISLLGEEQLLALFERVPRGQLKDVNSLRQYWSNAAPATD